MISVFVFLQLACAEKIDPEQETEPVPEEPEIEIPTVITRDISEITPISARCKVNLVDNGGADTITIGLCYSITVDSPGINNYHTEIVTNDTSGNYNFKLDSLSIGTQYYIRAFAKNSAGISYGTAQSFYTLSVAPPVVITNADFAHSTTMIFGSGRVTSEGDYHVLSKGLCWGANTKPTIKDNLTSDGYGLWGFYSTIEGLEPSTTYYVRAYAKTEYVVAYGDEYAVSTIAKGNFTYTVHRTVNDADEHYERIEDAMENAVYYYNNFTSITKHLNVYYNPGVATADGSINGTIRFGSNTGYQRTGTALHEIMHTVGVGQHWRWTSTEEFIKDGTYQKENANKALQVMTYSPKAVIYGDSHHFWPYGINGANEDTGEEKLYIVHAMIVQGMHEDGLPSEW